MVTDWLWLQRWESTYDVTVNTVGLLSAVLAGLPSNQSLPATGGQWVIIG